MTISDSKSIQEVYDKVVSYYRRKYPQAANDIEDMVQDVFVSVLKNGKYDLPLSYFKISIERYFRLMHLRPARGFKEHVSLESKDRNGNPIFEFPQENVTDTTIDLERSISRYPNLSNILLDGMDRQDIADRDGVTTQAVHLRITKELKRLQAELGDYGKTLNHHHYKRPARPVQRPDCVAYSSTDSQRLEA